MVTCSIRNVVTLTELWANIAYFFLNFKHFFFTTTNHCSILCYLAIHSRRIHSFDRNKRLQRPCTYFILDTSTINKNYRRQAIKMLRITVFLYIACLCLVGPRVVGCFVKSHRMTSLSLSLFIFLIRFICI